MWAACAFKTHGNSHGDSAVIASPWCSAGVVCDCMGGCGWERRGVLLATWERPCTMYQQHKVNYLNVRAFPNVIMLHFLIWVDAFRQYISCCLILCPFMISELRLEECLSKKKKTLYVLQLIIYLNHTKKIFPFSLKMFSFHCFVNDWMIQPMRQTGIKTPWGRLKRALHESYAPVLWPK